jgi:hypothetical protein
VDLGCFDEPFTVEMMRQLEMSGRRTHRITIT